jgi:hypothetical protein
MKSPLPPFTKGGFSFRHRLTATRHGGNDAHFPSELVYVSGNPIELFSAGQVFHFLGQVSQHGEPKVGRGPFDGVGRCRSVVSVHFRQGGLKFVEIRLCRLHEEDQELHEFFFLKTQVLRACSLISMTPPEIWLPMGKASDTAIRGPSKGQDFGQ